MISASATYPPTAPAVFRLASLPGLLYLALVCSGMWLGSASSQGAVKGTVIQFGPGFNRQYPPEAPQRDVIAIAAGLYHQMALKSSGEVVVWGNYQLTNVPPAARSGVTAIAAGGLQSIALKEDGTVIGWGVNEWGEALPPAGLSNVVVIAAGLRDSYAVKQDGSVVTWGYATTWSHRPLPDELKSNIVAVADGNTHKVALRRDGTIFQWDLSPSSTNLANVPQEAQSGVTAISAGYGRTAVLKDDGSVISWGDGRTGPLVTPSSASNGVIAVACAYSFQSTSPFYDYLLALRRDGTMVSWGSMSNSPPEHYGNGRFRAISAGGNSILTIYAPKLPTISPYTFKQWTVHTGQIVTVRAIATPDQLAPYATIQWLFNGRPLEGVPETYTPSAFVPIVATIPITSTNQSGIYTVVLSNDSGSVTSAPLAEVRVIEPVSLDLSSNPEGIRIAWHTNASDLILQSATNLSPPVTWTDWSNLPSAMGSYFVVTNQVNHSRQFFRLFKRFN